MPAALDWSDPAVFWDFQTTSSTSWGVMAFITVTPPRNCPGPPESTRRLRSRYMIGSFHSCASTFDMKLNAEKMLPAWSNPSPNGLAPPPAPRWSDNSAPMSLPLASRANRLFALHDTPQDGHARSAYLPDPSSISATARQAAAAASQVNPIEHRLTAAGKRALTTVPSGAVTSTQCLMLLFQSMSPPHSSA